MVLHVTDKNFDEEVIQSPIPTVVYFWADWLLPSKMVLPEVDKLSSEFAGRVKVATCEVESAKESIARFSVTGISCTLGFKEGQLVHRSRMPCYTNGVRQAIDSIL
jgi:thioredoxin 1